MKYICTVRGGEQDKRILKHIEYNLDKLKKLERRECRAIISIAKEKHLQTIEVCLRGERMEYTARAEDESIFRAIDSVINKITKQVVKRRGKIKNHRNRFRRAQKAKGIPAPGDWEFESHLKAS